MASLTGGMTLAGLLSGKLCDDISRAPALIGNASILKALSHIGLFASLVWHSPYGIWASCLFALGLGTSSITIPIKVLIAECTSDDNRAEAYGLMSTVSGIGVALGSAVAFPLFGLSYLAGEEYQSLMAVSGFLFFSMCQILAAIRFRIRVPALLSSISLMNANTGTGGETATTKTNIIDK